MALHGGEAGNAAVPSIKPLKLLNFKLSSTTPRVGPTLRLRVVRDTAAQRLWPNRRIHNGKASSFRVCQAHPNGHRNGVGSTSITASALSSNFWRHHRPPTIELGRSGVRRTKLRPLKDSWGLSRPRLASWNPAVDRFHQPSIR